MYDVTKDPDYVKTISTVLNPQDNGGEAITISTHIFDNGNGGLRENHIYMMTKISLQSYGRAAEINFGGALNFDRLEKHLKKLQED